ncbi:hypothetical protein K505DRAFT_344641, partial [Melanomma pulvis-pyrius CBS 109.77]
VRRQTVEQQEKGQLTGAGPGGPRGPGPERAEDEEREGEAEVRKGRKAKDFGGTSQRVVMAAATSQQPVEQQENGQLTGAGPGGPGGLRQRGQRMRRERETRKRTTGAGPGGPGAERADDEEGEGEQRGQEDQGNYGRRVGGCLYPPAPPVRLPRLYSAAAPAPSLRGSGRKRSSSHSLSWAGRGSTVQGHEETRLQDDESLDCAGRWRDSTAQDDGETILSRTMGRLY